MKRDEHKAIVNRLLGMVTTEHQAIASELLTQLSDDYEETLTNSEQLTATNTTLTANNEKLREVNANLFLRVGTPKNKTENETETEQGKAEEKELTYEALFNEKGELI